MIYYPKPGGLLVVLFQRWGQGRGGGEEGGTGSMQMKQMSKSGCGGMLRSLEDICPLSVKLFSAFSAQFSADVFNAHLDTVTDP